MERKWNIGTPMEQIQPSTIGYNQLLLRSIFFIDGIAANRINKRKARIQAISGIRAFLVSVRGFEPRTT